MLATATPDGNDNPFRRPRPEPFVWYGPPLPKFDPEQHSHLLGCTHHMPDGRKIRAEDHFGIIAPLSEEIKEQLLKTAQVDPKWAMAFRILLENAGGDQ
ncbi:hypothetical protein [Lacunimicrobium album]